MGGNNILREAGTLERIYNANHFSGFYPCFCLSAQYKLKNGFKATPSDWERIVRSAVSSFVLRHGALCSGVVGEEGQHPTFIRLKELNLAELIRFHPMDDTKATSSSLKNVLEDIHSRKWTHLHEAPGWKVLLFGGSTGTDNVFIIFAAHHAFMDGQGGMVFHRELFRALDKGDALGCLSKTPEPLEVEVPSWVILDPPVEDLMRVPTTWGFHIQNTWNAICPSWLSSPWSEKQKPWTGNPVTKKCVLEYQTKTQIMRIGSSELQKILAQCKTQQTTLTGLLHALVVALLTKMVTAHSFLGHTPYTLRKWTGSNPFNAIVNQTSDSSCLYEKRWLTAIKECYDDRKKETSVLWDIARFYRQRFLMEISEVPLNNGLACLGRYTDRHKANMKCIGQVRPLTFEVSNLGMVNLEEYESYSDSTTKRPVHIEPSQDSSIATALLTFSQSAMVNSAPLTLSVVSMLDGLTVSISWQPEALDAQIAEEFCYGLSDWFEYLGNRAQTE